MMFSFHVDIGCIYVCLSASASDVSAGTAASHGASMLTHLTERQSRSEPAVEVSVGGWTVRDIWGET